MNKHFLLFVLLTFSFCIPLRSQLPDGSIAPDFTIQDINGNSFSLYQDALNQGKYVVIDFFATWCPTCWDDFQDGVMESVHNWYGDEGTCDSDVIVIGIEADIFTNNSDLNGVGSNTQGNWVSGTSYRLFDPTTNNLMNAYDVIEYPMYYVICPQGYVYQHYFYTPSSMKVAALNCPHMNDVETFYVLESDCNPLTYTPNITFTNINIPILTSLEVRYQYDDGPEQFYTWNGNVGAGSDGEVILPTQAFELGLHTFHYTLENPNGVPDQNKTNNCGSPLFQIVPSGEFVELNEDFSGGVLPDDWGFMSVDELDWQYSEVNGGCLLMPGFEYFQTLDFPISGWTPHVDLSNVTSAYLQFDYAYAVYPGFSDGFRVEVRSSCMEQMVFEKYGEDLATAPPIASSYVPDEDDWETFCFDLTPFIGSAVSCWFEGIYDFGNNIYIDNFKITTNECAVGVQETTSHSGIRVFPNPTTDRLFLEIDGQSTRMQSCRIVDGRGKVVKTINPNVMNVGINEVDIHDLSGGIYVIECAFADHTETAKLVVER